MKRREFITLLGGGVATSGARADLLLVIHG
jgi:hypothetical protein